MVLEESKPLNQYPIILLPNKLYIMRYPRPRGFTKRAIEFSSSPNTRINKTKWNKYLLTLFNNHQLLYPYIKEWKRYIDIDNQEEEIREREEFNQDDLNESGIIREIRIMEIKEFSIFSGIRIGKIEDYLREELIREGKGIVETMGLNDTLSTSRANKKALKNKILTRHVTLTHWESELKEVARAQNYKAGITQQANNAVNIVSNSLKDLIALEEREIEALTKALNQGTPHQNNTQVNVLNHIHGGALPAHESGVMLTTESALNLIQEKVKPGLEPLELRALEASYLQDENIPDIQATPTDSQGIRKASINLVKKEALNHENRREITEDVEFIEALPTENS